MSIDWRASLGPSMVHAFLLLWLVRTRAPRSNRDRSTRGHCRFSCFSCFGWFERELRAQTVIAVRVAIAWRLVRSRASLRLGAVWIHHQSLIHLSKTFSNTFYNAFNICTAPHALPIIPPNIRHTPSRTKCYIQRTNVIYVYNLCPILRTFVIYTNI